MGHERLEEPRRHPSAERHNIASGNRFLHNLHLHPAHLGHAGQEVYDSVAPFCAGVTWPKDGIPETFTSSSGSTLAMLLLSRVRCARTAYRKYPPKTGKLKWNT